MCIDFFLNIWIQVRIFKNAHPLRDQKYKLLTPIGKLCRFIDRRQDLKVFLPDTTR